MQKSRGNLMNGVGERLKQLRKQLELSTGQMAARLGITTVGYYRNESDTSLPSVISLHRLHKDFGVSMDWLLFAEGPMFLKDRQPAAGEEGISVGKEQADEIKELLAFMETDSLLRHEMLAYFYKYKRENPEMGI